MNLKTTPKNDGGFAPSATPRKYSGFYSLSKVGPMENQTPSGEDLPSFPQSRSAKRGQEICELKEIRSINISEKETESISADSSIQTYNSFQGQWH